MLNLSEIKFSVETSELSTALGLVDKLGTAVSQLKTPVKALATESKDLAKAQKELNSANTETVKQTKAQAKATEDAAKASSKAEKASKSQAEGSKQAAAALSTTERVLEKQRIKLEVLNSGTIKLGSAYVELGQGLTAAQAGSIANMKIMGGTADQIKLLATGYHQLASIMGQNPFDASANGLYRVRKETEELTRINTLNAQGFGLTKDQVKLLSRDLIALEQNYNNAGKGQDELRAASERLTKEFVQEASVRNTLIAASAEMERQLKAEARARAASSGPADAHVTAFNKQTEANMKAAASAANSLERELERAENAVLGLNSAVQVSTSNRLLKFQNQLKASGTAADAAQAKYLRYSKAIQTADAQRAVQTKKTRADELKYLARATSVQLGDIGISLAGGQNPLLVFIQQGDQLRAVLNQVGGDAAEMKMAMSQAFKQIVVGFVDVGKAIGNFVIGSFVDAGKALTSFAAGLPGINNLLALGSERFAKYANSSTFVGKAISTVGTGLGKLIPLLAAGTIAIAAAGFIAFGVALKEVIGLENELNKAVTLGGAAMGISFDATTRQIGAMKALGYSHRDATIVLTEMAKAGNLNVKSLDDIAAAAIALKTKAGVPIEETVKKFSELSKEPTKALIEFAKMSGRVNSEIINQVAALEDQGRAAEASALAMKTFGAASLAAAEEVEANYGNLTKFGKYLGGVWEDTWSIIMGWGARTPNVSRLEELQTSLDAYKKSWLSSIPGMDSANGLKQVQAEIDALTAKNFQAAGNQRRGDDAWTRQQRADAAAITEASLAAQKDGLTKVAKITNEITIAENNLTKARANGQDVEAKRFEDQIKRLKAEQTEAGKTKKTPKSEQQKELDKSMKAYNSFMENMAVKTKEFEATNEDLNVSQKAVLNLIEDAAWNKLPANLKVSAMEAFNLAYAAEEMKAAIDKAKKSAGEFQATSFKNDSAALDALEEKAKAMKDQAKALDEENAELVFQATLIGKSDAERNIAIETRKIELELAKELAEINALADGPDGGAEKAALAVKAKEAALRKMSLMERKAAVANQEYWTAGITDAIMVGLTEGGSAGAKNLRDFITAELRKPFQIQIQATINDIIGYFTGGTTNSSILGQAASNYMSTGSVFGSGGAVMAGASTIGNTVGAGTVGAYYGAATGTMSAANVAGSITANAAGTGITGLLEANAGYSAVQVGTAVEAGAAAGTAAGAEAGVAAGAASGGTSTLAMTGYAALILAALYTGSELYDAGWNQEAIKNNQVYQSSIESLNYEIGSAIGLSDKWASILSGTTRMAHMFGSIKTGAGIEATVTNGEVAANNYQNIRSGWLSFKGDKTERTDADPELAAPIIAGVEAMQEATRNMALSLGLGTEAIDGFTGSFKLKFKGLTESEITENFNKELVKMQEQMLRNTEGFKELQKSGESIADTIARIKEEAMTLAGAAGYSEDTVSSTVRDGMLGRLSEADLGDALAEQILGSVYNALAQGFADQVTGAITSLIIQPIMTSILMGGTVSAAVSQASITAVYNQAKAAMGAFAAILNDPAMQSLFAELGALSTTLASTISAPAASIRTFTGSMHGAGSAASGAAKELYDLQGSLMQLLGMTAKLRERELAALNPANRAMKRHIYALEDAKEAYENVLSAIEDTLNTAKDLRDSIEDIFDTIGDSVKELRDDVVSTQVQTLREATRYVESLAGSDYSNVDMDKLDDALSVMTDSVINGSYATRQEEDKARLAMAASLEAIQNEIGSDLDKRTADIILLEESVKLAEDQINALLGIQTNTYSVAEGMAALASAVANYEVAIANGFAAVSGASTGAATSSSFGSSSGGGHSGGSSSSSSSGGWNANGYWNKNPDLQAQFNEFNLGDAPDFNKDPKLSARDEYLQWHWLTIGQKEKRKFANGGYYPGGLAMVGEEGPELINFSRPGQVYTAGQTASILDSDNSKFDARLATLEAAMIAVATNTSKMSRILDNSKGEDSTSLRVTVV